MSKIYRSQESRPRINPVDLRTTRLGSPHADRPTGGFAGGGREADEPVLSDLERRERESQRLIETARRQADTIQRDAYHEGFAQGEKAGERLAMQKIEPAIQSFLTLIESISRERHELIRLYESELIKIAFLIATEVLKTTIELEPGAVTRVMEAALAKVGRAERICLRVSPYDRQVVEQQMRRRDGGVWPPEHLRIEADESVSRGGCLIATDIGDIDATIETQLRVLKNQLWND